MPTSPRTKRRWLRYSLRALFVFVTLACVGFSWFGMKLREAGKQHAAVIDVTRRGGRVSYTDVKWRPPNWLRKITGDDLWRNVTGVYFDNFPLRMTNWDGAEMESLATFRKLRGLDLTGVTVSDEGLAHLEGLHELVVLEFSGYTMTGKGVEELHRLRITDRGLTNLGGLRRLRKLALDGTSVTDAGLVNLADMSNLVVLSLQDTFVADAGLVHLRALNELHSLSLRGTRVKGPGLIHLAGIKGLWTLDLSNTDVDDAGLEHLRPIIALNEISLLNCPNVTDEYVRELRQAGRQVIR